MSTSKKIEVSHVMVADGLCFDANGMGGNGGGSSPLVTVLVTMPMELKRKLHTEAKRRQQTLSEYICARCDFLEVDV